MTAFAPTLLPPGAQRPPQINNAMLWVIVAAWLIGAAYACWYFELRLQRPFVTSARATLFESGAETQAAEDWFRRDLADSAIPTQGLRATVVHVYDAGCPCNRFSEPHLAQIEAIYRQHGVRFVRVERLSRIGAASPRWIEATPAALVFDSRGRLTYFGPYSDAAACGTANGLVERVLDQMLSGRSPTPGLVISGGCFCARKP